MAGDWIKWSKGLASRREVVILAAALRRDRHEIAGRLMVVWEWLDDNVADSEIDELSLDVSLFIGDKPFDFIDALVGLPGFADALASDGVRWLSARSGGRLTFPHFGRHNGTTAKTRALESRKKQKQRATKKDKSPDMSRNDRDNNGTREEESKRREELREFSHPPPPASERDDPPIVKKSKALRDAIKFWNQYWTETLGEGRPDSPTRIEAMLAECLSAGWSEEKIIDSIRRSVGWRAKSWRDPDVNFDEQAKSRPNGRPAREPAPLSERC